MEVKVEYKGNIYEFKILRPAKKDLEAYIELSRKGKAEKASKVLVFSSLSTDDRKKLKEAPEIVQDKIAVIVGQFLGLTEEEPYIDKNEKIMVPVYDKELEIEMFEEFTLKEIDYERAKELIRNARGVKLLSKMKEIVLQSVEEDKKMETLLNEYPLLTLRIFATIIESVNEKVKTKIKK